MVSGGWDLYHSSVHAVKFALSFLADDEKPET